MKDNIQREHEELSHLSNEAYDKCVQVANNMSIQSGRTFQECLYFLAKSSLKEYSDKVNYEKKLTDSNNPLPTLSNAQLRQNGLKKKNTFSEKLTAKFAKQKLR